MPKHTHKFIRTAAKKTSTWRCMYCGWFVHDGLSHIVLSKQGECWSCGDTFQMTEHAMEEDKPRCDACRGVGGNEDISEMMLLRLKHQSWCPIITGGECNCGGK